MKKIMFSVPIIVITILCAYYLADYFGVVYSSLFGFGNSWIGNENSWNFIIGLPLSLIFFLTTFTYAVVFKSWKSTLWLISPLLLWEMAVDIKHIYIPIILGLVGFALAELIRFIISKFHHPNPPMVIK